MKATKISFVLLVFAIGLICHQLAEAQNTMRSSTFGNGGGVMEDGDRRIIGTLGQPLIGVSGNPSNFMFAGFWYTTGPPPPAPAIELTSPNGGEVWCAGSQYAIQWMTTGVGIARVHLQYSTNGGVDYQDITTYPHLPNTGTYQWTVPQVSSTTVLVKAIARDAGDNPLAEDVSNANFTISLSTGDVLSISLYQGFNLFSIPFHPLDPDLDVALAGIMTSMDSILALRNGQWKVSAPNPGGGGWAIDQVKTLNGAEAYVIYMKNLATLVLAGTPLAPADIPELLQQGFNLAPYNSTSGKTVDVAFAGIRDDVDTFLMYNAAEGKWKACVPNPAGGWHLKQFGVVDPGWGLVIYLKADSSIWNVEQ